MIVYLNSIPTGDLDGFARVLTYPKRPRDIALDTEYMCLIEWCRMKRGATKDWKRTTQSHPTLGKNTAIKRPQPLGWVGPRLPNYQPEGAA